MSVDGAHRRLFSRPTRSNRRKEYSMGLIDFIKDVGHKLNIGHEEPKAAPQAQGTPQAAQGPSQQDVQALENRKKTTAITNLIQQMGLKAENLNVQVSGDKA